MPEDDCRSITHEMHKISYTVTEGGGFRLVIDVAGDMGERWTFEYHAHNRKMTLTHDLPSGDSRTHTIEDMPETYSAERIIPESKAALLRNLDEYHLILEMLSTADTSRLDISASHMEMLSILYRALKEPPTQRPTR